jgi:hypothetical protein
MLDYEGNMNTNITTISVLGALISMIKPSHNCKSTKKIKSVEALPQPNLIEVAMLLD